MKNEFIRKFKKSLLSFSFLMIYTIYKMVNIKKYKNL